MHISTSFNDVLEDYRRVSAWHIRGMLESFLYSRKEICGIISVCIVCMIPVDIWYTDMIVQMVTSINMASENNSCQGCPSGAILHAALIFRRVASECLFDTIMETNIAIESQGDVPSADHAIQANLATLFQIG